MKKLLNLATIPMILGVLGSTAQAQSPFVNKYVGVIGGFSRLSEKANLALFPKQGERRYKTAGNSGMGGGYLGYGLDWGGIITSLEGLIFYDGAKAEKKFDNFRIRNKRGVVYEAGVRAGFLVASDSLIYIRAGSSVGKAKLTTTFKDETGKKNLKLHFLVTGFGVERIFQTKTTGNFIVRLECSYQFTPNYSIRGAGVAGGRRDHGHLKSYYVRAGLAKPF